jgi:hypothetical protein
MQASFSEEGWEQDGETGAETAYVTERAAIMVDDIRLEVV